MKVSELIDALNQLPDKNAEVFINHWLTATKSDKVILGQTKAKNILKPADGTTDMIIIDSEAFQEEI